MLTKEMRIKIIETKSYGSIKYETEIDEKHLIWHCEKCGLYFMRNQRYFSAKHHGEFCKVCNIFRGDKKKCEIDFIRKIQEIKDSFSNVLFVAQVSHDGLRAKKERFIKNPKELIIDIEVYIKSGEDYILILGIEINENKHKSYMSNQDNLKSNYMRKKKFLIDKQVAFVEISYTDDGKNPPTTPYRIEELEDLIRIKLKDYNIMA